MTELKTLKDIENQLFDSISHRDAEKIRQEAIKWIQEFEEQSDGHYETLKRFTDADITYWIKYFFNITEKDLGESK